MRGYSPILTTAALSLAVLASAFGVRFGNAAQPVVALSERVPVEAPTYVPVEDSDGNGTPDWQDELLRSGVALVATGSPPITNPSDPLSSIASDVAESLYGGYLSLKQYGEYTPARGEQLANTVAQSLQAPQTYTPHAVSELSLDTDMSEENVLAYRTAMRTAVAPMVTDEPPELEFFARYLETKDPSWLTKIAQAAKRYEAVEINLLNSSVPQDAAPEHLRALNSVGLYAHTLNRLSLFGNDALASIALLKTQNEAEKEMLLAFDSLAQYYVRKVTN